MKEKLYLLAEYMRENKESEFSRMTDIPSVAEAASYALDAFVDSDENKEALEIMDDNKYFDFKVSFVLTLADSLS